MVGIWPTRRRGQWGTPHPYPIPPGGEGLAEECAQADIKTVLITSRFTSQSDIYYI